jgi:galactokinase
MNHEDIVRLLEQLRRKYKTQGRPQVVRAPGRVNLLGEHTDYNEGFVFPMAIDAGITMVGALNGTNQIQLYSLDFEASDRFSVEEIVPSSSRRWTNYLRGVCAEFKKAGLPLQGLDLILEGNVPQGAGLSSSAALEVAAALLISALHDWEMDRVELVKLAQRAENDFVGVASGIMDQFASMMGQKDHALFLDCRSLDYELIPTPFEQQGYSVVVTNTRVQRGLVESEYNARRQECSEAVEHLKRHLPGISSLRDVSMDQMPLIQALPPVLAQRARHVVTENDRVLQGILALQAGDLVRFGQYLNASHDSLRFDFEVSCPELDLLVELAQKVQGVLGSRMTGAGFGGCTISLVPQRSLNFFKETVSREYRAQTGLEPEIFVFSASQGARTMEAAAPPQS